MISTIEDCAKEAVEPTVIQALGTSASNAAVSLAERVDQIEAFIARMTGNGQPPHSVSETPSPNGSLGSIGSHLAEIDECIERLSGAVKELDEIG